ncbi:hypothetical protein [Kocuria sp.]|uniref:hypothetical protein n=1 Tax=Kocuria sp. TaxID=1871328 RepID=UPI0026DD4498|nr:hypothetical protein [Kocuria sp.]MDO4920167.1 hypothetical protein [Kocuria sp.]
MSRPARFFRGWAAAGTSILCAATSHCAVDPEPPGVLLLAVAFSLAGMVCVLLAGRRMGALRTGCAVLLSQVPFHLVFSGGGHSTSPAASPADVAALAHAHHDPSALHAVAGHGAALSDAAVTGHGPMIWAHLLAAAVTFVLLRHAEDGWWRFLEAAARFLFTAVELLRPVLVPCHGPRPVPLAYLLPPLAWSPVRVISRRGPPLLSV